MNTFVDDKINTFIKALEFVFTMNRGIIAILLLVLLVACTQQRPLIEVNNQPYNSNQPVQEIKEEQAKVEEQKEVAQQEEVKQEIPALTEGKVVENATSAPSTVSALQEAFNQAPHFCVFQLQDPVTSRVSSVEIWIESANKYRTRSELATEETYTLSALFDGDYYYYWDSQTEEGIRYTASEAAGKSAITKDTIVSKSSAAKCKKLSSVPSTYLKVPSNIKFK